MTKGDCHPSFELAGLTQKRAVLQRICYLSLTVSAYSAKANTALGPTSNKKQHIYEPHDMSVGVTLREAERWTNFLSSLAATGVTSPNSHGSTMEKACHPMSHC